MVRFNLDDINEDMVLGESIFLPTGELLLGAGYQLKRRYIERLRTMGYHAIMVQVEGTEEVLPESVVSEAAQREMLTAVSSSTEELQHTFDRLRHKGVVSVKDIMRDNRKYLAKFIMNAGMGAALEQFIDEILSQESIVLNLSRIQAAGEALFTHTMNVTITALCIGRKFHLSYEELKQLAIGAINYDLGLVTIPKEILEKEGTLSEDEKKLLQQHTLNGYLMLSEIATIPSTSAAAALQHHEHQNGSGYPGGLQGDNVPPLKDFSRKNKIHRFAEIIAVADKYDMMTSGRRHYSSALDTREAIKKLIALAGPVLNTEIVKVLTTIVPLFPVGARVKIAEAPSTQLIGYRGVVARDNPKDLENPQIIIYETRNHMRTPKPILIDMSRHPGFKLELLT
jgi:HD-GYP domain-containing protein (c-di-GMP phosphodiesterase class II)